MDGRVLVAGSATNQTNVNLVAHWCAAGIDAELVPATELRSRAGPGDAVLGRLDVLPSLDGVERGLLELLLAERAGLFVLNPARALLTTHDKLRTARALAQAGLPTPRTVFVPPHGPAPPLRTPAVVKPRFGSWGRDVFLCRNERALADCLAQVRTRSWFVRHGALVQELLPLRGYDLRVIVAGGRVVGSARRVAAPDEWRTNISLGGTLEPALASRDGRALALAASAAVGADLVGIDLLPTDEGYVALQLNAAVDYDQRYAVSSRGVYADTAAALGLRSSRQASHSSTARPSHQSGPSTPSPNWEKPIATYSSASSVRNRSRS